MPFINTITTKPIDKDTKEKLTREYGRAIALIPGKSENWLMLKFEGDASMSFRGNANDDCAMIAVDLYGEASAGLDSFTNEATRIVSDTLGIPTDRIYLRYFSTKIWGYDGENF